MMPTKTHIVSSFSSLRKALDFDLPGCSERACMFGRGTTVEPVSFILSFLLKQATIETKARRGWEYPPERRSQQGGKQSPELPHPCPPTPPLLSALRFPAMCPCSLELRRRTRTVGTSHWAPTAGPYGTPASWTGIGAEPRGRKGSDRELLGQLLPVPVPRTLLPAGQSRKSRKHRKQSTRLASPSASVEHPHEPPGRSLTGKFVRAISSVNT